MCMLFPRLIVRVVLCLLFFGWGNASILAQETAAPPNPAIESSPPASPLYQSPRDTLRTFLEAMSADPPEFDSAVGCMEVDHIAREGRQDVARYIYRCINRLEWVELEHDSSIPDVSQVQRSPRLREATEWSYFPRKLVRPGNQSLNDFQVKQKRFNLVQRIAPAASIVLTQDDSGQWKFSEDTVTNARTFWETLESAGIKPVSQFSGDEYLTIAEHIEKLWPIYFVQNSFLTVKYWQWLTMFLMILLGMVFDLLVRMIVSTVSRRIITRKGGAAQRDSLKKMVRPFGLAAAALFWLTTFHMLGLPNAALLFLVPALRLFAMLAMVWAAYRVTDIVGEFFAGKAAATETKFDDLLVPLVRKTIKIFITAFGLIYIAESLDVPIMPLVTGLGIGGVGFAFAAKDTLEHLFGSVTVIADRPFQVGDWVVIGDVEGTVEEVGFRSTRVRTFYNSLVTVPNGNLVRAVIDNYGKRKYKRWSTHVNLTYDTPPDKLESFCEGIRELVRLHPYTRKDYYQVWLHKFGAHSLDVLLYVFWKTPDWQTELRERHRLMMDIIRLADQLGVEFAFPTQTLHLHQEEAGDQPHEPGEAPPKAADFRAMRAGRTAARRLTSNAAWREQKPPPYRFKYAGETLDEDENDDDTQIESKIGGDG